MARLEFAVLKFLAGRHDGCRDLADIFSAVMNPDPKNPGLWQVMCLAVEKMEKGALIKSRQEKAEGHRLLTRVCLTATGWQKLGEDGHGKSD